MARLQATQYQKYHELGLQCLTLGSQPLNARAHCKRSHKYDKNKYCSSRKNHILKKSIIHPGIQAIAAGLSHLYVSTTSNWLAQWETSQVTRTGCACACSVPPAYWQGSWYQRYAQQSGCRKCVSVGKRECMADGNPAKQRVELWRVGPSRWQHTYRLRGLHLP